ncbi:FUSC family protein [Bacillus massiliigorillae]|uniref:FUSC family protein n=1 Tax=Bacillus massiliigorillae TaxID=1243664 RepID=UPI001E5F28DE|nr:FUSC family protein [Bacillus massiliigorillae]
MLMYLERDLTVNPWKNFFFLLGINLLQGIFGHLSTMNLWVAIPLNFISMFIVGYFFSFNLKKPLYIAFGLQYLFILTTPIATSDLPLRLLALASGAVIVMLTQFIVNKDKLSKAGNKHLITTCNKLNEKLDCIMVGKDCSEVNKSIEIAIKELRKIIYYRRFEGYYLSQEGRLKLKISACLEKMYMILNRFDEVEYKSEVITACKEELENVKQLMEKKPVASTSLQDLRELGAKTKSLYINEIVNTFELLYDLIYEVQATDKKDLNKVEQIVEIPTNFKSSYNHFVNFNKNSVRFTYAMRLGIMITLAAFITDYFQLELGRWMIFTLFSVTQPYSEQAKYRFSERVIGTLIGAVIFGILFSIFTDATSRSMLILVFGYLNSYAVAYRNIVITVTVCALGTAALVSDPNIVTIERVLYVLIGVVIGMIANRTIFPHSIQKGTTALVQMYKDTSKNLMEEVYKYFDNKANSHSINNLFAITSFIEDRIILNNETMELKHSAQFLEKQRKLNNGIYELFLRIQRNKIDDVTVKLILDDIHQIMISSNEDLDKLVKHLKAANNNVIRIDDHIVLNDIIGIFEDFKKNSRYHVELKPRKA